MARPFSAIPRKTQRAPTAIPAPVRSHKAVPPPSGQTASGLKPFAQAMQDRLIGPAVLIEGCSETRYLHVSRGPDSSLLSVTVFHSRQMFHRLPGRRARFRGRVQAGAGIHLVAHVGHPFTVGDGFLE